jgi:tetratricopeptide (TPR) repeat protein
MIKKIHLTLYAALLIFSFTASAQKQLRKAEILFENGDYLKAADSFKAHLKSQPQDYFAMALLAESLALSGDLGQADLWFKGIPSGAETNPYTYKKHGDVLKKMGHYDEAINSYRKFMAFNPSLAEQCIQSCEYAVRIMSEKPAYETFILPASSSASDFGLTFYKDMPVFSSFREDILMTEVEKEMNERTAAHRSFLYTPNKNRLGFIKGLNGKLNHIGPLSFASNGKKCAVIESKLEDNYSFLQNGKMSSLSIAEVNERGEITSSVPFAFNEVGSTINSAHLAFDGTALYFSSNRSGGFGGYDIYVSYQTNGIWSLPKNLGSSINTEGNEVTPFLKSHTLYFASDFHPGLGGYDIVYSEVINGNWMLPINPGYGVNSPADDYFPAFNTLGELYITSNRLGGRGNCDIYKTLRIDSDQNIEEDYADIPPAVNLEELALETTKNTVNTESAMQVSLKDAEAKNVAFSLPEFDSRKVGTNVSSDFSLEGARRIGLNQIIPNTEVFFIQLASMSSSKPNFDKFKPLLRYGNIYKMLNNKTIKVRLGYFTERKEAEDILSKVRLNGYKDAFLAYEILNTAQMELVLSGTDDNSFSDKGNFNTKNPEVEKSYKSGNKYKVRLASYEDPIWFDVNKVKDLGRIEQWTKGGWTIFILAGYNDLDEAKKAQIQSLNRGFKTAEVVIDNGGILERLKQN